MFPRALLPFLPLLIAVSAVAQERIRFDILSFELPAGWTRISAGDQLSLRPSEHAVTVTVGKSSPLEGTIAEHCQKAIDEASKLPEYHLEAQPGTGRHPRSRGQWHNFVYSYAHPDQRGKYRYVAVLSVAAGGRCVSFTVTADGLADYEATRLAVGAMVDGVELTTTQRLERGSPPLTRYMVDETIHFLEWLVHSPLTEEQRAVVESELRRYWKERIRDEMDGVTGLLAARSELAKLGEAERELARQAILEEAVAGWRQEADSPGARMMLAIHDAANQPIAKGEPPLTRQAVDAFAEFLAFAAGQVAGCEGKLAKETRDMLAQGIADGYADLSKEERETIAGMPMVWAALRVAWPDLPEQQQRALVDGWRKSKAIADLGGVLAQQAAKARELESASELIRRQAQLQAINLQYQVMQNVMTMQQNTFRIISSNMGGNTSWTYRW